jgi:hypothetical protein
VAVEIGRRGTAEVAERNATIGAVAVEGAADAGIRE